MKQKQISITVPMDYFALTRASDMLHGLAQDVHREIDHPLIVDGGNLQDLAAETPASTTGEQPTTAITPAAKKEIPRTDKPDPTSLDADGIPWDARIHGKSQTRLTRGDTWTLIRGLEKKSPGLIDQVKAELKAATAANAAGGQPTTTPASQAFGNQQQQEPAAQEQGLDFAGLMSKITPRLAADPNYNHTIQAVLVELNVPGLPALLQSPELIPQVDAKLDALWQG